MKVSMAISCIWAWLVPHFYIEFTEYQLALSRSPAWNDARSDRNEAANRATINGAGAAIFVILVVTTGTSFAISLPTRDMDERADAIVVGLGRILSGFLFAVFSVQIPKWLGVTYSSPRGSYFKDQIRPSATAWELSFRVCWSLLGHYAVMFCILLLYFCNPDPGTILVSTASKQGRCRPARRVVVFVRTRRCVSRARLTLFFFFWLVSCETISLQLDWSAALPSFGGCGSGGHIFGIVPYCSL
jgi:hypothetical protein